MELLAFGSFACCFERGSAQRGSDGLIEFPLFLNSWCRYIKVAAILIQYSHITLSHGIREYIPTG